MDLNEAPQCRSASLTIVFKQKLWASCTNWPQATLALRSATGTAASISISFSTGRSSFSTLIKGTYSPQLFPAFTHAASNAFRSIICATISPRALTLTSPEINACWREGSIIWSNKSSFIHANEAAWASLGSARCDTNISSRSRSAASRCIICSATKSTPSELWQLIEVASRQRTVLRGPRLFFDILVPPYNLYRRNSSFRPLLGSCNATNGRPARR